MSKLFNEIEGTTAVNLIQSLGKDAIQGHSYSMKGNSVIAGFDCTLRTEQWEALIANADKILYWHYDFNPKCKREITLWVGTQYYSVVIIPES